MLDTIARVWERFDNIVFELTGYRETLRRSSLTCFTRSFLLSLSCGCQTSLLRRFTTSTILVRQSNNADDPLTESAIDMLRPGPSNQTFSFLVNSCRKSGNVDQAINIFRHSRTLGIEPGNSALFQCCIVSRLRSVDVYLAYSYLRRGEAALPRPRLLSTCQGAVYV